MCEASTFSGAGASIMMGLQEDGGSFWYWTIGPGFARSRSRAGWVSGFGTFKFSEKDLKDLVRRTAMSHLEYLTMLSS
jgi:hypothetical protein